MGTPKPLTCRISDAAVDALAEAYGIQCPLRRDRITELLKLISYKADRLHQARLFARSIEDAGIITDWNKRRIRDLEHAGGLEVLEYRPLPMPEMEQEAQ